MVIMLTIGIYQEGDFKQLHIELQRLVGGEVYAIPQNDRFRSWTYRGFKEVGDHTFAYDLLFMTRVGNRNALIDNIHQYPDVAQALENSGFVLLEESELEALMARSKRN